QGRPRLRQGDGEYRTRAAGRGHAPEVRRRRADRRQDRERRAATARCVGEGDREAEPRWPAREREDPRGGQEGGRGENARSAGAQPRIQEGRRRRDGEDGREGGGEDDAADDHPARRARGVDRVGRRSLSARLANAVDWGRLSSRKTTPALSDDARGIT